MPGEQRVVFMGNSITDLWAPRFSAMFPGKPYVGRGISGPSTVAMITENLASMAELAQMHGIRVVLASVLPVLDYPWKRGLEPAPKIIALNAWIRSYAATHDATYLDYYAAMVDGRGGMQADLSRDGVHPNDAGYRVMTPLAERAIAEALGKRPR